MNKKNNTSFSFIYTITFRSQVKFIFRLNVVQPTVLSVGHFFLTYSRLILSFFFPSMPVSLSRMIHHSHSFTRLEINHHIHFISLFLLSTFLVGWLILLP